MLYQCDFNKEVIVMGDFNLNWEDHTSRQNLKQITDGFNLVRMVKGPTWITNNTSTQHHQHHEQAWKDYKNIQYGNWAVRA